MCLRTQITILCSHASGPTPDPSPRPVSLRPAKTPWPSYYISPTTLQSKALKEKSPIGVSGSCLSSSAIACNYRSILQAASLYTKRTLVKIRTGCPLLADERDTQGHSAQALPVLVPGLQPSLGSRRGSLVPGMQWDSCAKTQNTQKAAASSLLLNPPSGAHTLLSKAQPLFLLIRKALSPLASSSVIGLD